METLVSESHPAMQLLRAGIPLSLLLDLANPEGPDTRGIMEAERRDAEAAALPMPKTLAAVSTARNPFLDGLFPDAF
jgi:hypothetical protein